MAMGATYPRPSGTYRPRARSASHLILAAAAIVLALAGCGRTPDAGVATTTTAPPDETTVATTVAPSTTDTTTPATSTTAAAPTTTTTAATTATTASGPGIPPKPEGEPTIELATFEPDSFGTTVIDPATGFVRPNPMTFEDASGFRSYRVTLRTETRVAGKTTASTTVAVVDGLNFVFEVTRDDGDDYTLLVMPQGVWVQDSDEWIPVDFGMDGFLTEWFILPDIQMKEFADDLETLTFIGWDLIDNVWYAHYEAGSNDTVPQHSDVWLSPDGFLHSYDITFTDPDTGNERRESWHLSDLGTATIDLPDELSSESNATGAETLRSFLANTAWTGETLVAGQGFSWTGRTAVATTDADPTDSLDVTASKEVLDLWGEVAEGADRRQHWYVADEDTRESLEEIVISETGWHRTGTLVDEQEFVSDGTPWTETVVTDGTPIGADDLLAEARQLFDSGAFNLEWLESVENLEGFQPSDQYRARVKTTDAAGSTVDATLEIWTDATSSDVRIVMLIYRATVVEKVMIDGEVAGTDGHQTWLFVSTLRDVIPATTEITPPPLP